MIIFALLQAAATPAPLQLVCAGGGTANKPAAASIYGSNGGSASIYGQRQQDFADQVDIRLFSGDDRIRMPRTMLPPIRGGSDGWFRLKNVQATDRTITATVAVNFINSPKMHLDRVTGTLSLSGKAGDYVGQCERVDPNAAPKF